MRRSARHKNYVPWAELQELAVQPEVVATLNDDECFIVGRVPVISGAGLGGFNGFADRIRIPAPGLRLS